MSIIERSYKLRLNYLSATRVFSDDFLLFLSNYIESDEDKEKYTVILITEFRGNVPNKFIKELLK